MSLWVSASRVKAERLVLVRVDLRFDELPCGASETLQVRQPGANAADGSEPGDADRGRDQHQPRGSWQRGVRPRVECVTDGQRGTVGVTDHVDGFRLAQRGSQVEHREPGRRLEIFHFEPQQSRRRDAVPRQAQADDAIAARCQRQADAAQAVRGVRQAVQQQHAAVGVTCRLQDESAIPVERPDVRVAETARIEPVEGQPVGNGEVLRDVSPDLVQKQLLALTVLRERRDPTVGVVGSGEFGRETHAVPGLQLGPGPQEMQVKPDADEQQCRQQRAHRSAQPASALRARSAPPAFPEPFQRIIVGLSRLS